MPRADGSFKGLHVPAEAWERIFGPTHPNTAKTAQLAQKRGTPRAVRSDLCELYENHLDVLGPNSHSPFIAYLKR